MIKRLALFAAALLPLAMVSPAAAATGSLTFTPTQDVFVSAASPGSAGNHDFLRADNAPRISYLKFNVSGVPTDGTVTTATLRLRGIPTAPWTSGAVNIHKVGNSWSESTTYNTRPGLGTKVATGTLVNGGYTEFTVPITGNGVVSFAVAKTTAGSVFVGSSEHADAAVRPRLTVNYSTPEPPPPPPPTGDDIFAEHEGFGDPRPTNPTPIVVTSNADSGPGSLRAAAAGSAPKYITFANDMVITVSNEIPVGSNTVIDGRGHNIAIRGTNTSGGFFLDDVNKVTLAYMDLSSFGNLALTSADDPYDAILMYGSTDIWVHHLGLSRASDKAIGMQQGTGDVTVSWCHFHDQEQTFQSGSDSGGEALDGVTRLTAHHNYFDGTGYRHPVMSYGKAHVYNNYYRDFDLYGARSQRIAQMHFENNVLNLVRSARVTLITGTGGANKDTRPGFLTLSGNVALPGSLTPVYQSTPAGSTFDPHAFYSYTPDVAGQALADRIVAEVGP